MAAIASVVITGTPDKKWFDATPYDAAGRVVPGWAHSPWASVDAMLEDVRRMLAGGAR